MGSVESSLRGELGCSVRLNRLLLQFIFLLLGVGVLVPWNAFISAKDYFEKRICENSIESTFTTVYNLSSVITMGLILLIQGTRDSMVMSDQQQEQEQQHLEATRSLESSEPSTELSQPPQQEEASSTAPATEASNSNANLLDSHETSVHESHDHSFWLVMVPLSLYVIAFLFQSILVLIVEIRHFFAWTIISLAVCGASVAIAQSGIVATASLFEAELAMEPYLAGQSVGGVAVSLANFMASSFEDPDVFHKTHCSNNNSGSNYNDGDVHGNKTDWALSAERNVLFRNHELGTCSPYEARDWAVFLYFFVGSIILLACLIGYSFIGKLRASSNREDYETVHSHDGLVVVEASPRIGLEMHSRKDDAAVMDELLIDSIEVNNTHNEPDGLMRVEEEEEEHDPINETAAVWKHAKGPACTIFLTFFVTLSLFPGWTSELRSVHQCNSDFRIFNDLYTPYSFLLFNVGDLVGRLLCAKIPIKKITSLSTKLLVASCLRFAFFPLLFLCVGGSNPDRWQISSDLYSQLIQFAFALSNGLLLSMAFVLAPTLIPSSIEMQERSSEFLSFAVAFGLLCGSLFSFPISKIVLR